MLSVWTTAVLITCYPSLNTCAVGDFQCIRKALSSASLYNSLVLYMGFIVKCVLLSSATQDANPKVLQQLQAYVA